MTFAATQHLLIAQVLESPSNAECSGIGRVLRAIKHRHFVKVEWADVFQTRDIDPVLIGVGAALMVSMDATLGAEEMLRGHRVELIRGESILSRKNLDA